MAKFDDVNIVQQTFDKEMSAEKLHTKKLQKKLQKLTETVYLLANVLRQIEGMDKEI